MRKLENIPNTVTDIVNSFDEILEVRVDETDVITKGLFNGFKTTLFSEYKHSEVAKEVAKKVSYFIGVK